MHLHHLWHHLRLPLEEMLCLAAGTHAPKELEELDLSKQLLWE